MTDAPNPPSRRQVLATALILFLITFAGCAAAFAIWLNELYGPQVMILGSGNQLSVLVVDGPARLLLATGNDANGFENALASVRPIFARRVDVLLIAGGDNSALVPLAAQRGPHIRVAASIGPFPDIGQPEDVYPAPKQTEDAIYRLGSALTVAVESRYPFGADPTIDPPAWKVTIQRGQTRIVVVSDGAAASLFSPLGSVSALVVSGDDPAGGWPLEPAPALITNAEAISGPDLRSAFTATERPPNWMFRVSAGEALRLRFVPGGIEIPAESGAVMQSG